MIHSDKWVEFSGKPNEMTRPHLGANLYAKNRDPPAVPWKPDTKEAQELEEAKAQHNEAVEKYEKALPQAKEEESTKSATSIEFNLLANLINSDSQSDNFKLNIFPDQHMIHGATASSA